ncbi:MAG: hypothetical protein WCO86_14695, partial [Planctomycetota bacterium]
DLEYDPSDIHTLWEIMVSGSIDVVYGSRYLKKSGLQEGRFILQSGVRLLNWMIWCQPDRSSHLLQTVSQNGLATDEVAVPKI